MLLGQFVKESRTRLSQLYPVAEASSITGLVCTGVLGLRAYEHIMNPDMALEGAVLDAAVKAVDRLMAGEPLQYILGRAEFYGLSFKVNPSVLIPRPETEIMCREALKFAAGRKGLHVLDLCTGSGCIAWTMAANLQDAQIIAVDLSQEALSTASSQEISPLSGTSLHFVHADILDTDGLCAALGDMRFDIILSNPPYVLHSDETQMRANVLDWEPHMALFVENGAEQEFNRAIAKICVERLNADSLCLVEINEALGDASAAIFRENGLKNVSVDKDFSGKNRFVRVLK